MCSSTQLLEFLKNWLSQGLIHTRSCGKQKMYFLVSVTGTKLELRSQTPLLEIV